MTGLRVDQGAVGQRLRVPRLWTVVLLMPVSWLLFVQFAAVAAAAEPGPGSGGFDADFVGKTMRLDYYHSGNAQEDRIALDRVVADGPWAGSRTNLVDALDLGQYCFEVRDAGTHRLLYSRGFCSVFGEWQTTAPARREWGTFHESLRFPWPKQAVQIVLKRRVDGVWRELWTTTLDPRSPVVVDAPAATAYATWSVQEHGDASEKVDVVILGDGYTAAEVERFRATVRQLTAKLFEQEPFRSRQTDFNIRAIDVPSAASGVNCPHQGISVRSPLSCQYDIFGTARYVLTFDNRTLRDVASTVPYDCAVILVNGRTHGGGGIYNDQATVCAESPTADYVFIHEFGHLFAGLADEYYTAPVAYETDGPPTCEPWEPNITALLDPAQLKWRDLVEAGVPLPTPWNKEAYEGASRSAGTSPKTTRADGDAAEPSGAQPAGKPVTAREALAASAHVGKVGAFEGAAYRHKGLYRPSIDCVMFSRHGNSFCPVCRRAIERVIDQHTKR
ncbi:MAG: peptidase M64 [Planctomycetes bacterium]|nr:peptidase M64 [Planctomycetota bacterium]